MMKREDFSFSSSASAYASMVLINLGLRDKEKFGLRGERDVIAVGGEGETKIRAVW